MTIDISKIIDPAKAVVAPLGGSLSEAWAAILGDRIASWRLKNAAEIQKKVNDELSAMGLKIDRSKIPERYAIAWFEEATKQDEPEIQDLFARLLARAAAGDLNAGDRRLIEIVGRLTPLDAQVLRWLFEFTGPPPRRGSISEYEAWKMVRKEYGESASLSLEHILLLGIFERQFSLHRDEGVSSWRTINPGGSLGAFAEELTGAMSVQTEISSSDLGLALFSACLAVDSQGG